MSNSVKLFNSNISIADDQFDLLTPCTYQKPDNFLNSNEYSRYVLCCLTTTYHDNLAFYKFPPQFKIYKADINCNHNLNLSGKEYFYFNAEDASIDGCVYEFKTKKTMEVVALDRVSNIEVLMASALNDSKMDVFDALSTNFHLDKNAGNKKMSIIRHHDQINDYHILNYLCSLGFDGFAFKPLNNAPGELHLCETRNFVSQGNYSRYNQFFVKDINTLK